MAAEEADVDIEGDLVPVAAQFKGAVENWLAETRRAMAVRRYPLEGRGSGEVRGVENYPLGQGLLPAWRGAPRSILSVGLSRAQRAYCGLAWDSPFTEIL